MADLVVREIEAKETERLKAETAAAVGEDTIRMLRESVRFPPATVLIDTVHDGWMAHSSSGLMTVTPVPEFGQFTSFLRNSFGCVRIKLRLYR